MSDELKEKYKLITEKLRGCHISLRTKFEKQIECILDELGEEKQQYEYRNSRNKLGSVLRKLKLPIFVVGEREFSGTWYENNELGLVMGRKSSVYPLRYTSFCVYYKNELVLRGEELVAITFHSTWKIDFINYDFDDWVVALEEAHKLALVEKERKLEKKIEEKEKELFFLCPEYEEETK